MQSNNFKTKFSDFCRKVGKRNFIIMGALVLTVAVVAVNLVIFAGRNDGGFDYDQSAGMDAGTGAGTSTQDTTAPEADASDSYFTTVQVDRQRTRDEAIEVLQSVVDNASSTEAAKTEALAQINRLAALMEAEANIETLIEAKGFVECVAVLGEDSANIVVKSEQLLPAHISQINEIVYEQAGIKPVNIKIIQR